MPQGAGRGSTCELLQVLTGAVCRVVQVVAPWRWWHGMAASLAKKETVTQRS